MLSRRSTVLCAAGATALVAALLAAPAEPAKADVVCKKRDANTGICLVWIEIPTAPPAPTTTATPTETPKPPDPPAPTTAEPTGTGSPTGTPTDGPTTTDTSTGTPPPTEPTPPPPPDDSIEVDGVRCTPVGPMTPQPPLEDPIWGGHTDGAIYLCYTGPDGATPGQYLPFWSATPPRTRPASPVNVAKAVVEEMTMTSVRVGMTPEVGKRGRVGLPVYLWVDKPDVTTWGPQEMTLTRNGISVTANAAVSKVVWDMGDGHTVTCTSSGTPYTDRLGVTDSPDCGYRYPKQGNYTVTATSYWSVDWTSSTGATGSIPLELSTSRPVDIGELQVVQTNQ